MLELQICQMFVCLFVWFMCWYPLLLPALLSFAMTIEWLPEFLFKMRFFMAQCDPVSSYGLVTNKTDIFLKTTQWNQPE